MDHRIGLLWLIVMAPRIALAGAPSLEDVTPDAVYVRGNVANLSAEGNSFLKVDVGLGLEFTVIPGFLTGRMEVQVGPGFASFNQSVGDDLSASTDWSGDAFVSLLGSGRLTLFRRSWLDVGTRFTYEASLLGTGMQPKKFSFKDDSGTYDVTDFAKEHVSLAASWTRLAADIDVRVPIFEIWTAYASVGLTRYTFALQTNIDSEGKELIRSIGQEPSDLVKTYDLAYLIPTVRVGSDVSLPNLPFYLTAEVALVPVSIEQLFLGASLGIGLKL